MIKEKLERFIKIWNSEFNSASAIMTENRLFNKGLREQGLSKEEIKAKKLHRSFKTSSLESHVLINELSNLFINSLDLSKDTYKSEGSIGTGVLAEIPWICIFDQEITTSAQNGFYIVFLFRSDMKGVYMSLNQGWTQYEHKFGIKEGKIEIQKTASRLKTHLNSIEGFSFEPINLHSKSSIGKGSEIGNICSKYYSSDLIPDDDVIINDLKNLIELYRELKDTVGNDILDIDFYAEEIDFQDEIQKVKIPEIPEGALEIPKKRTNKKGKSWSRNSGISHYALIQADYSCENSKDHTTFISKKSGRQFVEAHHLIPMEYQDDFSYSIDIPENIISLCPNCHRAFHNAEDNMKKQLISKSINDRLKALNERGIIISYEQLLRYYNIND